VLRKFPSAATVRRMPMTLRTAFSLALAALARERWLAAVGLLVTLLQRLLLAPAPLVAGLLLLRGAFWATRESPFDAGAPLAGTAFVAAQPRVVGLVLGLWLAGALLAWLLRLAWLAGALPTLAGAFGGREERPPRFAAGLANGLPRLAVTAFLGVLVEVAGAMFAVTLVLAAARVGLHPPAGGAAVALAAAMAAGLTLAVAVPLLLSLMVDTALVRCAVLLEGPAEALAEAASRVLARPAAYLLAALVFAVVAGLVTGSLQGFSGLATGFTLSAPPLVALGPQLMLSAAAALLAAALELWWLASLAALNSREAGAGAG
jgi:hypothetical protein